MLAALVLLFACSKKDDDDDTPTTPPTPVGCFDQVAYTDQLPNQEFENWGFPDSSGNKYQEPCGGVWTSSNAISNELDLICVKKSATSQTGSAAVEIKTNGINLLGNQVVVPGFFFCGKYKSYAGINIFDPLASIEFGVPFTKKPASLKGFQRYTSVNGDSAYIAVLLSKYNPTKKMKDTIGFGDLTIKNSSTSYSEFNVTIDYKPEFTSELPDSVVVLYTSSKGIESLVGEIGSTLLIDNCTFVY